MVTVTKVKSHEVARAKSSVLTMSGVTHGLHDQTSFLGLLKMCTTMWRGLDDHVTWSRESAVCVALASACHELDG
ncbi:hypothetical protein ACOSP7_018644 [Xanthoceras sorbifolium]